MSVQQQFLRAEQAFLDGKLQESATLCKALLDQDPDFAPGYSLMGALFKATGNFTNAVKFLDLAIRLNPKESSYHVQKAHNLLCAADVVAAKRALNAAQALGESGPMFQLLQGNVAMQEQRFTEALAYFDRVIAVAPSAEAYEFRGLTLQSLGRTKDAKHTYEQSIALWPQHARAYFLLGKLFGECKEYAAAEPMFQKALERDPALADAWVGLARLAGLREEMAVVIQHLTRALQIKPDMLEALQLLAGVLLGQGMHAPAEELFQRILNLQPDNLTAIEGLAKIHLQFGRLDQAKILFEKVLKHKPNDPVTLHFYNAIIGKSVDTAPAEYVAKLFDEYADRFDAHLQQQLGYNTPRVLAQALEHVAAAQGKTLEGLSVLDLGCGTGLGIEALPHRAAFAVGVDLSAKMLAKAQEKSLYQETAVQDIVEYMRATPHRFDLVLTADVLVYIGNLDPVFAAAHQVLKPGGWFVLSVEQGDDAPPFVLRKSARYGHAKSYIESLVNAHGFAIRHLQSTDLRKDGLHIIQGYIVILERVA